MLPIPMFLLLVFTVAVLAPAPAILIHFMKTVSLSAPPSHISTIPALPSTPLPPAVETLYLPIPDPQPTLDVASVCLSQDFVNIAPNITTSPLRAREASDFTTRATILPVVILAMVNCLVYRLLVDDTNGTRSQEELEQPVPTHLTHILSEEIPSYHTIYEIPSPRPVIDTITTGFLEHDGLSDAVTVPSRLEVGTGLRSSALFEQPSQFPAVLSYGVLAGDSEQATIHDSTPATLSVSGCTSCDDWTQEPTAQSTDSKGSSSAPIASVTAIIYSGLVPPHYSPLGIEAVKTSVDHAKVPPSQEPERQSEPQDIDNPTPPPAVEGACDVNDVPEAFLSHDPEGDDGETFDYKGVDWEPRAPATEICTTASPYSSLEPLFEHGRIPSKAGHGSTSSPLSASTLRVAALQSSTTYAPDDILVGVKCKNEAKIAYNTRRMIKCASAGDLRSMVDLEAARAFPVPDSNSVTSLHITTDTCISLDQVALLRADLPDFTPRTSAMSEEVASSGPPQRILVGLKGSIYAPRNDDLSRTQTQEDFGALDLMHSRIQASPLPIESKARSNSPGPVSAVSRIQESTHSPPTPRSQELADSAAAESSTSLASGLEFCALAPAEADTRTTQTPKELAKIPVPSSAQVIAGSNSPRSLAASMHAPKGCLPSQAKREIAGHSADAPNWAAAAREDSAAASRGSSLAQRGKTPDQGLDDGDELDVPTATRCAVQDENERFGVDDSGGSIHPSDDLDGAAGPSETDSGLDAAEDPNEQEFATRSRRSRRRGKPQRPRTKVPYLPPPRMRNLTQHPIANMLVEAQVCTD
ncbi:hypothetical protein H4582DRAFT_2183346 [Lactarius indigo]|nr:hypothetical protein H4582DRAFT_2183346 [Lactarius indigo]